MGMVYVGNRSRIPPYRFLENVSGAFSPSNLSNLLFWFDGSDASTIFQDTTKTIPVTANADPVGNWEDKSANGFDVMEAVAANQPSYRTNVQNGLSAVRFSGTADRLSWSAPHSVNDFTLYFCGKLTAIRGYILGSNGAASDDFVEVLEGLNTNRFRAGGGAVISLTTAYAVNNLAIITFRRSGTDVSIYLNGVIEDTDTQGNLLTFLSLGQLRAAGSYFTGDMFEVFMYSRSLLDAERTLIINYLNEKWAIF